MEPFRTVMPGPLRVDIANVERYFRDAPLMIVGEGTNEIQRNVIAAQLVARGGI
jgi:alkylation response protein AidB-like acyl-CoA dehydrogenase